MIDKLSLKELPFVDGVPDASQERIRWIRNGECIEGASTKYGHDGNLNAPTLGVQTNVERLEENTIASKDKINELVESVNVINDALDIATDTTALEQIHKNMVDIADHEIRITEVEDNLDELTTNFDFLREDVGYHDPLEDGPYLTVRENIILLKTEIGHYENQDINSNPLPEGETNEATGMKRRIMDNTTAINDHGIRIDTLEQNYEDSDVGQLGLKVNEIREELGPRSETVGKQPAYTRITELETAAISFNESIDGIKTAIDFTGTPIGTRVSTLELKTASLEDSVNVELKPKVAAIETAIGTPDVTDSINGRLGGLRTDVNELRTVVGASSSDGLRFQVSDINRRLGSEVSPAAGTINKRLNDVVTQANQSTSAIQDIQVEIGNNQTGLKGSILKLTNQVEGTNPNGSTVTERGLINAVTSLETQIITKIGDAPVDGKMYGRIDGDWSEIVSDQAEIDGVKASLALTDGKVAALTTRVDDHDTSIGSLDTRTGALNTTVGEIKTDVTDLQAKDVEQDGRISALEASDVTITGKITALETQVTDIDTDVTQLALDISDVEGQLAPIKADVSKNKGDIVTLTGRVGANEGEIADIKLDTAKIAPLATRVTTAEGKITALETSTGDIDTEIEAIKLDTAKIAGISTKADSNEGKITTLEGKVSTAETDIAAIKLDTAKIDPLTARVVTVEGKVGVLEGQMVDVETEVAKIPAIKTEADKVAGINIRLTAAEGKITALEGKVSTAEGKITALETELAKRPPEAPTADGLPYVLVDNAWVLLSDFVTLNPAP